MNLTKCVFMRRYFCLIDGDKRRESVTVTRLYNALESTNNKPKMLAY